MTLEKGTPHFQTSLSSTRHFHTRATPFQLRKFITSTQIRHFHIDPSVTHKFYRFFCNLRRWTGFVWNCRILCTEKEWPLCGSDVLNKRVLMSGAGVGISENFPGTRYSSVPKIFFLAGTRYLSVPNIYF